MRFLLKMAALVGSLVLIAKLMQLAIDFLYDNYGKRYISYEDNEAQ